MLSENENNAWVEKQATRLDEEANLREERDNQQPQKQRYSAGFSEHAYFFNCTGLTSVCVFNGIAKEERFVWSYNEHWNS